MCNIFTIYFESFLVLLQNKESQIPGEIYKIW